MNKQIRNYNDKRKLHGYQEWYYHAGKLSLKGNIRNGVLIGYIEWHAKKETEYYII
jgi:antitoxin component YwqK of YwqJK toxin-antitoxin module